VLYDPVLLPEDRRRAAGRGRTPPQAAVVAAASWSSATPAVICRHSESTVTIVTWSPSPTVRGWWSDGGGRTVFASSSAEQR